MDMSLLQQLMQILPAVGGSATLGVMMFIGFKGTQWVVDTWFARHDVREENLSVREQRHKEDTDKQINEMRSQIDVMVDRFGKLERDHDVLMGIVHAMIDDPSPAHSIAIQLHLAYPLPEDMPPRMRALLARLEAKYGEEVQPPLKTSSE